MAIEKNQEMRDQGSQPLLLLLLLLFPLGEIVIQENPKPLNRNVTNDFLS